MEQKSIDHCRKGIIVNYTAEMGQKNQLNIKYKLPKCFDEKPPREGIKP